MIKQDDFLSILKENKNDFVKNNILIIYKYFLFIKENFMMIKERLLFSNDYSSINKKCFSCKQFDHIIEECPKLHFVPNIEKIIKRYNYPFLNERAKHIRKNNKSQNALLSIKIIKKNFSGFNKRIKIIKKEVKYGELDNSELNYSLEEEEKNELEEQKNNLNNNDSIAKLESLIPFSLSLPEENPEINIKNINVSNQNDLNELQIPNESFSSSILNTSQKNIEPQHSLNKTLSHTNSFKIDEQILNNPSNNNLKAIEPNSFKKIESNKTFEQSSENHRNSTIKCQNVVYNEIEIDKVYNFNNYFVDFNIETFSKNLPWFLYKEKQIMRRYLKKKYSKFKDYTFFGSRFLCKLNKEFICKRKKMKNIVSPELTIKLEKEETLKTNSKIKKLTLSSNNNSPLKKKTYFGKMEDNDEKINDFSQLFKAVMEKKKKKINKSHLSGNKN